MRLEEALNIRYMQRRKYLENENYERLSDILSDEGNNPYRGRRDNYMFINLLMVMIMTKSASQDGRWKNYS